MQGTEKNKTLLTDYASKRESIMVNGEEVEDVEEFAQLGAIVLTKEIVKVIGNRLKNI